MMHYVPQPGLTVPAVAGPVERVVRPHRADAVGLELVDMWRQRRYSGTGWRFGKRLDPTELNGDALEDGGAEYA
jgi:hypothetical protein